ncbi:MAG: alpha/beta hydrolase [Actinomycetota bacterium]
MKAAESTRVTRSRVIIWLPCLLSFCLAIALIIYAVMGWGGAASSKSSPGAPDYADPGSFTEQEVTVGNGEWSLPGTLTMPGGDGPFPAVVLVHGSGPNNRDEGGDLIAPFRDLAWGLASRGIAVLRYDKRTLVYQDELAAQGGKITVWEETVDDAAAAVELLLRTEGIDAGNVFVLGHSLGGMLIPRIAGASPRARGFVILAGVARPFEDLILEQTEYIFFLDGEITPNEQASLDQLRTAVDLVKSPGLSPSTPASELPFNTWGGYWLDLRGYDPAGSARSIDRPILVLQGERDYQVTMDDFSRWEQALSGMPNVALRTYPDLNHLFITGTGKSVPAEYNQPGHVSQEVVDDIASFVKANLAGE